MKTKYKSYHHIFSNDEQLPRGYIRGSLQSGVTVTRWANPKL